MKEQIKRLEEDLAVARENSEASQGNLAKEVERLRVEIENLKRQF